MGVNDKVRTDLDLHNGSNLGMGVYAIERPYPKVGVGQIWKQYLKQLNKRTMMVLYRSPEQTALQTYCWSFSQVHCSKIFVYIL